MNPRKPYPFKLEGEVVADCFVDSGQVVVKGRRVIVVDAVFHLIDAKECAEFANWLSKATAWRNAKKGGVS